MFVVQRGFCRFGACRRLRAARDRLNRASYDLEQLRLEIEAAHRIFGRRFTELPKARRAAADDVAAIEEAASTLETEISAGRARLEAGVLEVQQAEMAQALGASLQRTLADPTPIAATPASKESRLDLNLVEILAGASVELEEHELETIGLHLEAATQAGSRSGQLIEINSAKLVIQRANDKQKTIERERGLRAALDQSMDGYRSERLDLLRSQLRHTPIDSELPTSFAMDVEQALAEALAAEEASYVADATVDILQSLGYSVGDEFATAVTDANGAVVGIPTHAGYGVRLRSDSGRLFFNVVAWSESSSRNPETDQLVEEEWCDDFEQIMLGLEESGVSTQVIKRTAPGATAVMTIDADRKPAKGRKRRIERERKK